jgi:regulator of RNase E activity RraA
MDDLITSFHNRFSTALLADAAFRSGVNIKVASPGLLPLDEHSKIAGPVVTVQQGRLGIWQCRRDHLPRD